jgi:hypothetical protein
VSFEFREFSFLWFLEFVTNFFHIGKGAGGKKIFKKKRKKGGLLNYILFSFLETQNKNFKKKLLGRRLNSEEANGDNEHSTY